MRTHPFTLVTIIAEPVLEARLTQQIRQLGASGWTVTYGRGEGSRGIHAAEIPGENVRIETIVPRELADQLVTHLAAHYFVDYEVIAYTTDVQIVRSEKYLTSRTEGA